MPKFGWSAARFIARRNLERAFAALLLGVAQTPCKRRDMMCDVANSLDVSSNLWPSALDESKARACASDAMGKENSAEMPWGEECQSVSIKILE